MNRRVRKREKKKQKNKRREGEEEEASWPHLLPSYLCERYT